MGDSTEGPLMPYTFECVWDKDKFRYTERARVPDDLDADEVAATTEQKMLLAFDSVDFPEQVDTVCKVESIKAGTQVQAVIEIRPGRPEGFENIGIRLIGAELMTQIAADDKEVFEDLIKFAKMMSGNGEYDEELVDDITPETPKDG